MSFLLLAFRKLSLRRRIDNGNFKLLNITMNQNKIQNQLAGMEEVKSTITDAWNSITTSTGTISNSVFQAKIDSANQYANEKTELYNKAKASGNPEEIARAEREMDRAVEEAKQKNKSIYEQQYAQAMAQAGIKQAATSLFEASEKAQKIALNRQDKQYTMQKESLNTQMESWNAEYGNLEKQVQTAAQQSAPKYVA